MSSKDSSTPADVAEPSVGSPSFQRSVTRNVELLRLVAEDRAESAPPQTPENSR
jgi:hypothetical protein